MTVLPVDILYGACMAMAGAVAAHFVCCRAARECIRKGRAESSEARKALLSLYHLTLRMASHVDEHSDTMQKINEDVQAEAQPDPQLILKQVARIVDANEQMRQRLSESERRLQEQAKLIESQATEVRTDPLTRLINRRGFDEEIGRRSAESKRHGNPFSVIMLDLDHFKRINDQQGHQAGDELLRGVAGVLCHTMREIDLVARYGGEEFVVVLPNTRVEEAVTAAERARQAIEQKTFRFSGQDLTVTASFGVAQLRPAEHPSLLVRRADEALSAAKNAGRNNTQWHDGHESRAVHSGGDTSMADGAGHGPESEKVTDQNAASQPESVPSVPPCNTPKTGQGDRQPDLGNALPSSTARVAPRQGEEPPPAYGGERQGSPGPFASRTEFCRAVQCRLGEWKRGGAGFFVVFVSILRREHSTPAASSEYEESLPRALPNTMAAVLREMDLLASYRPDCFGVLLPAASPAGAGNVAQRLRQAIEDCFLATDYGPDGIGTAAGLAHVTEGDDMVRLLMRAEEALKTATDTDCGGCYRHDGQSTEPVEALDAIIAG